MDSLADRLRTAIGERADLHDAWWLRDWVEDMFDEVLRSLLDELEAARGVVEAGDRIVRLCEWSDVERIDGGHTVATCPTCGGICPQDATSSGCDDNDIGHRTDCEFVEYDAARAKMKGE